MMKKYILPTLILSCFIHLANAQNVGIGTGTPQSKLEVKDSPKTRVTIASQSFTDTTQLKFSNRTIANAGTDMIISANQEQGLRFSSESDLPALNQPSILNVTPTGRVGVNAPSPTESLDVNGNMNISGTIKANGNAGQPNQVLMQNESGNLTWGNLGNTYKNFDAIYATGSGTWTVPANVTSIMVELTGGGSGGTIWGGGAGGAYIMAQFTVSPGSTINYTVGAGSVGTAGSNSTNAFSSTATVGAVTLTADGGLGGTYNSTFKTYSAGGGLGFVSPASFKNYITIPGAGGAIYKTNFIQKSATVFLEQISGADGGGPGYCRECIATGAYIVYDNATSTTIISSGGGTFRNYPGTGGAGGYYLSGGGFGGGNSGKNGLVIFRY